MCGLLAAAVRPVTLGAPDTGGPNRVDTFISGLGRKDMQEALAALTA